MGSSVTDIVVYVSDRGREYWSLDKAILYMKTKLVGYNTRSVMTTLADSSVKKPIRLPGGKAVMWLLED